MASTDKDILGRVAVDDIAAFMDIAAFNDDADTVEHVATDNADAVFTWNYDKGERPRLARLYEKFKTSQWNATTDFDWSIEVDPTRDLNLEAELQLDADLVEDPTSPITKWDDKE